jgi:branched-chain amino acid transport system substrate-binding protein
LLALKKLIDEDKVSVIVGPSTSGVTLAMVDTVQKAEVPLISAASSIKITEPVSERKWVFNTVHSDRMVAHMMADYFLSQGITQLAIMNMNNAYGDSGRVEFEKAASETGLSIVATDKFEATDTDMTAQLTRIGGTDAQGIVVWAIPPSSAVVTKNAYDMGLEIPIFQNHAVGNQDFIDLATKEAAEGILIPVAKIMIAEQLPDDDPQKDVLVGYATEYRDKYGTRPTTFGGHAWDGFQLSVNAMQKVGPDRAAIRDELENTKDFVGISAILDYSPTNHNGINGRGMVMASIQDGEWILLE